MQVYTGCIENPNGFYPVRDPKSKWYTSYEEMPDSVVRACWLSFCVADKSHMDNENCVGPRTHQRKRGQVLYREVPGVLRRALGDGPFFGT